MSSRSGLKKTDGQRLSLFLANLAGPTAPILHATAKHPSSTARGLLDVVFAAVGGNQRQGVSERDLTIGVGDGARIGARLYTPWGVGANSSLLVYYPGGGFVLGSVASHANTCRFIAREGRCQVLAIDYRKSPDFRFPIPLEDCVAAFRWAVAHAAELRADPSRIGVGGDSAGGGLAAVVCLETATAGDAITPRAAWLAFPFVDSEISSLPSGRTFAKGPLLTAACATDMLAQYAPARVDQRDPRVSPLANERLDRMPDTYIASAGMDPLRDQAEVFAHRLSETGVNTRIRRFSQLPHGFVQLLMDRQAREATREACAELPRLLSASARVEAAPTNGHAPRSAQTQEAAR